MPINPMQTASGQTQPTQTSPGQSQLVPSAASSREQLVQDFLYELERSLLLEETEKDYWRNRAATMPL